MNAKFVYLECQISAGAFSDECVFELKLASGDEYIGIAPRKYCRTEDGHQLASDSLQKQSTITGKIAARLIRNGGDVAVVAIPDGEAVEVSAGIVSQREPETSHVSV